MRTLLALLSTLIPAFTLAAPVVIPTNASWHLQLSGPLQTPNRLVYDIDLYDTPTQTITHLKSSGRIVICYFSAGTWEDWRSDAKAYPPAAIGKALPDWPGEHWLDYRRADVRQLRVGLKNAVELLPQLGEHFDFAINESCYRYKECDGYGQMRSQGKAIFIAEYRSLNANLCARAENSGFRLQFFKRNLKGIGQPCD